MLYPTRRALVLFGVGIALALLPSIWLPALWPAWMIFAAVVLCLMGVDSLGFPSRKRFTVELETPPSVFIGEPAEAELLFSFNRPGDRSVEALVDLSELFAPAEKFVGVCPPTGARMTIPLKAVRRGVGVVEALWIRDSGPLRLMERVFRVPLAREVSIVPNVLPARRAALRMMLDRQFFQGMKIERYRGDGTEFESLREYVPGDLMRDVHWRSSGRHRKLLSVQHRAERNHPIVIAVDTGRLMAEPIGGLPKLDRSIEAALLLAFVGLKSGDRVGLFGFAEKPGLILPPEGGVSQFRFIQQASTRLTYSHEETNFTLGLTTLSQKLHRRSLVVVLTDFVDSITAELMLENLARLNRKHLVVVVALRDPLLDTWRRTPPTTVLELNRANAAAAALAERELVLRRLQQLGLQIIDAAPHRIGPELVNRYLDIKRRERV
jgi:uncharacterized protein (DUF58 family)